MYSGRQDLSTQAAAPYGASAQDRAGSRMPTADLIPLVDDFCNKICHNLTKTLTVSPK
jgi:hypothetical protein